MDLYLEEDIAENTIKFWLIKEDHNSQKTFYLHYTDKGVNLQERDTSCSFGTKNSVKPFLTLPRETAVIFMELLAPEIAKKGIRTENENLLKGKLEAKEEHIKDLQKVLEAYVTKGTTHSTNQ